MAKKKSGDFLKMPKIHKKDIHFGTRLVANFLKPIVRALYRIEVKGVENVPKTGGYVIAANHVTYLDALAVAYMVYFRLKRTPHFLAKGNLFKAPVIGSVLLGVEQVPVYRGGHSNREPMDAAHAVLDAGRVIAIFPEGTLTREPDGWPMRGKIGAVKLALDCNVPFIPMAQWGTEVVLPTYSKKLRPKPWHPVRMIIGEPLNLDKYRGRKLTNNDYAEATELAMAEITRLTEILRDAKAPAKVFDPREHGLSEHGNFKKAPKKQVGES
ncbi:MAG: 1-acyl-sn-glycerol-3-phosphate acyltransferase [Actinomycetales bacterium]|nr:1-acyl-sn-glycerol-3-phosphate acyltransferase [Actinomycetales bacterium]